MIRLFTYLTLDVTAPYEPTASDQYHDLELSDFDCGMSDNYSITTTREGLQTIVYDPKNLYPIMGSLIIPFTSMNMVGVGSVNRYLAPVLYRFHQQHLPVCIFQQGMNGVGKKCYLGYMIAPFPEVLASLATNLVQSPMNTSRMNLPRDINIELSIILDGVYFDIDNLAGASWINRA